MLKFWLRSISVGLLAAAIIIASVPSLRAHVFHKSEDTAADMGTVQLSFNQAVHRAAPAVVNIYSRQYDRNNHKKLSTQGLGSGVIVSKKAISLPITT